MDERGVVFQKRASFSAGPFSDQLGATSGTSVPGMPVAWVG